MSEAHKPHSIADDFKIVRNAIADFGGPGPWDAAYHSLNYIEEQLEASQAALREIVEITAVRRYDFTQGGDPRPTVLERTRSVREIALSAVTNKGAEDSSTHEP